MGERWFPGSSRAPASSPFPLHRGQLMPLLRQDHLHNRFPTHVSLQKNSFHSPIKLATNSKLNLQLFFTNNHSTILKSTTRLAIAISTKTLLDTQITTTYRIPDSKHEDNRRQGREKETCRELPRRTEIISLPPRARSVFQNDPSLSRLEDAVFT